MFGGIFRSIRRLRAARARWSASEDRTFHDQLFAAQPHDPFSESYVGHITICRFADLAAPCIRDGWSVLDLGCGPGEITCELARRFPHARFHGVDHSDAAIRRALGHAQAIGLNNIAFECADVATFVPRAAHDLIVMFDAFHHMIAPTAFVRHFSRFTERFFLIEPAGDRLGRWRRRLDLDWLPVEIDKIRARLEYELGVRSPAAGISAGAEPEAGRAVEHRYPLSDYEAFFKGFHVEARGTVAGFDVYPPAPTYDSPWRRRVMQAAQAWIAEVDEELLSNGADLDAKHWAIYATVHPEELRIHRAAEVARPTGDGSVLATVVGPYDAHYAAVAPPTVLAGGVTAIIEITVGNRSWREWSSDSTPPIHLSYHWLRPDRSVVDFDGARTRLSALPPAQSRTVALAVRTPSSAGRYQLEVDLVEEGITWFSRAGVPPLRLAVTVR